jgi:hypothetical protein
MKQASFKLDSSTSISSTNNNSTSKPSYSNNTNNSNTNNSNNTITSIKPKKLVENIYYFQ